MVLWSRETKMLIIIELTVPWEERCNEAHERKLSKYEDLLAECKKSRVGKEQANSCPEDQPNS